METSGNFVKANTDSLNSIITSMKSICSNLSTVKSSLSKYSVSDVTTNWTTEAAKSKDSTIQTKVSNSIMVVNNNHVTHLKDFNGIDSDAQEILTILMTIKKAIETFESESPSLEEALESLNKNAILGNFSIDTVIITGEDGESTEVERLVYKDAEGNVYTIAEQVNAFFTTVGMNMSASVAAGLVYSDEELENKLNELVGANGSTGSVNEWIRGIKSADDDYFKAASTDSINALYTAHNMSVSDSEDYSDELSKNETYQKYLTSLGDGVASTVTAMGALAIGVVPTFGFNYQNSESVSTTVNSANGTSGVVSTVTNSTSGISTTSTSEPTSTDETTTTNNQTTDSTNKETETATEEDVTSDDTLEKNDSKAENKSDNEEKNEKEEEQIEIAEISTEEDILEEYDLELTEEEIDELASEQYDNQFETEEEYTEFVSKQYEKFDELWNGEGKTELINKLTDYGYNSDEIKYLLDNKDICMDAYLAGEKSADLTKIANEIAVDNGITNFDTAYDDADYITITDLADGKVNVYLSNAGFDSKVSNAKASYTESKTTYEAAAKAANEAIKETTSIKEKISDYKDILGSDTSNWTDNQIEKYNELVNDYNDAIKVANEAHTTAEKAKSSYLTAKENYVTVKNNYYDEISKSITSTNNTSNINTSGNQTDVNVSDSVKTITGVDGSTSDDSSTFSTSDALDLL